MDMAIDECGYAAETPPLSAHLNAPSARQACATAPENLPGGTEPRVRHKYIVLIPAVWGKHQSL